MSLDEHGRYCELLLGRELVFFHGDDDECTWRAVEEINDPLGEHPFNFRGPLGGRAFFNDDHIDEYSF